MWAPGRRRRLNSFMGASNWARLIKHQLNGARKHPDYTSFSRDRFEVDPELRSHFDGRDVVCRGDRSLNILGPARLAWFVASPIPARVVRLRK